MRASKSIQPGDPVRLNIRRQACPNSAPYWEEFEVAYQANMNVVSALMEIEARPVTVEGKATTPVAYDVACLEEVCGSCTMVINRRARQSCSALIRDLKRPISLEPMRKFPVLRDLVVDRAKMFARLKQVKAWVPIDGTFNLGPGPKMSEKVRALAYEFSRCMTCGCCLDACPQVNGHSAFMGPSAIGQVYLFNSHPTGAELTEDRLDELSKPGGIAECGNAQNCERACPKQIPLVDAMAHLGRRTTVRALRRLLDQ